MIFDKIKLIISLSLLCLGISAWAQNGITLQEPSNVTRTIQYDPVSGQYIFVNKVGDFTISDPV